MYEVNALPNLPGVVQALGEQPLFQVGDRVRIGTRVPIGHYRVPTYLRGKVATILSILTPAALANEEEGFGRNAGNMRHYYRVNVLMSKLWVSYRGNVQDSLSIEVFETWLERV